MTPLCLLKLSATSYDELSCKIDDNECLVTYIADYQIVAFRGTEASKLISGSGWRDVLRDIRLCPWYDKRVGWSHSGFLKGARALVDHGLQGFLRKDKPIILTGHSLGGVLAINSAMMLHAMGFKIEAVVTFGAPRTLLRGAVRRFIESGIPISEYSNPGDPVPDHPFRLWGYRHVNEIMTDRKHESFFINNHLIDRYLEAFDV